LRKLLPTLAAAIAIAAWAPAAMAGLVGDNVPPDDVGDDVVLDDDAVVPEPTAALAMGVGLATIAFALRRRR